MDTSNSGAMALEHITITSGHTRTSAPDEVDPGHFPRLSNLIKNAVAGRMPRIPGRVGKYHLSAAEEDNAIIATVWAVNRGRRVPVVTFGVATDAGSGAHLWRSLHTQPWMA